MMGKWPGRDEKNKNCIRTGCPIDERIGTTHTFNVGQSEATRFGKKVFFSLSVFFLSPLYMSEKERVGKCGHS